jgi:hypothetical protein
MPLLTNRHRIICITDYRVPNDPQYDDYEPHFIIEDNDEEVDPDDPVFWGWFSPGDTVEGAYEDIVDDAGEEPIHERTFYAVPVFVEFPRSREYYPWPVSRVQFREWKGVPFEDCSEDDWPLTTIPEVSHASS